MRRQTADLNGLGFCRRQLIAESKCTVIVHRDVGRCNVYDRAFLARELAANNQGIPCRHRRKLTVACTIQEPLRLADAEHIFTTVEQNAVGGHALVQHADSDRLRRTLFQELDAVSIFCIVALPCLAHRSAGAGRPDELCILRRMISVSCQTADFDSRVFFRKYRQCAHDRKHHRHCKHKRKKPLCLQQFSHVFSSYIIIFIHSSMKNYIVAFFSRNERIWNGWKSSWHPATAILSSSKFTSQSSRNPTGRFKLAVTA